jgi:hypothetical protein
MALGSTALKDVPSHLPPIPTLASRPIAPRPKSRAERSVEVRWV